MIEMQRSFLLDVSHFFHYRSSSKRFDLINQVFNRLVLLLSFYFIYFIVYIYIYIYIANNYLPVWKLNHKFISAMARNIEQSFCNENLTVNCLLPIDEHIAIKIT